MSFVVFTDSGLNNVQSNVRMLLGHFIELPLEFRVFHQLSYSSSGDQFEVMFVTVHTKLQGTGFMIHTTLLQFLDKNIDGHGWQCAHDCSD